MGYWNNISLLVHGVSMAIIHFSQAQNSIEDYVNVHNAARTQVGVGPMRWDSGVANYAQNYANQRKGDCQLIHSENRPYGENLSRGGSIDFDFTGVDAVKLWVDEKADYDYDSNTCLRGEDCEHYTQVVWRNSVRLGCARVQCNDGQFFVTCNYDPPGNVDGQKPH